MSQDRAGNPSFRVTHEFLAHMLGVRRAGISGAAFGMQRDRLISYQHGDATVLDRRGLEAAACGCYAPIAAIAPKRSADAASALAGRTACLYMGGGRQGRLGGRWETMRERTRPSCRPAA